MNDIEIHEFHRKADLEKLEADIYELQQKKEEILKANRMADTSTGALLEKNFEIQQALIKENFDHNELSKKAFRLSLDLQADHKLDLEIPLKDILIAGAERPGGIPVPRNWKLENIYFPRSLPTMIGGYTGIGKSRMMINIIYDCIKNKRKCLVFSLEMTVDQLLAILCLIHFSDTMSVDELNLASIYGMARNENPKLMDFLDNAQEYITIVDAGKYTASDIAAAYSRYAHIKECDPEIVCIDYLQIITPEPDASRNDRRLQVIQTVEILTEFTKRTLSAWIFMVQMSRRGNQEGADVDSSAFQESASIEQNAGLAIMLFRPKDTKDKLSIKVSKNRFGRMDKSEVSLNVKSGAIHDSRD